MKVSELTGAALDWAVSQAENKGTPAAGRDYWPEYSTNWAQSGPIIEREELCIGYAHQCDPAYVPLIDPAVRCWARTTAGGFLSYGEAPLIAAMRCYVASKLGDDVEVPSELF